MTGGDERAAESDGSSADATESATAETGAPGRPGPAGTGPPTADRTASDADDAADSSVRSRVARAVLPSAVRRSYALKFALVMLAVILLVAGVGGVSYVQIQDIIEEDATNTLRSTATVQADSVSEWVAGVGSQATGVAMADVFATEQPDRIRSYLDGALDQSSSDVVSLHYVDPEGGTVVASTTGDLEGASVAAVRPAWQSPIETVTAGDGGAAGEDGAPRVGRSDRAYERNGRLLMAFAAQTSVGDGVLVVVGDIRQDFEQLHESRAVVRTRLLDAEGLDVVAPRQSRPSPLADAPAFDAALAGETDVHERETDVLAFAPVADTDWVVVTEAPKSQLYEASATVGRNVAVLVASTLGILALAGLLLGRGTVAPLRRLRRRAEAMEDGDLDVDLSTEREDEIGRLFVAFDSMRTALRDQIREAEAARDSAERSRRELARQNERLDQFASTVSHDLRNPLNVADGHRDLLARKLEERTDDDELADYESHLETIGDSHDRMEAIVQDVLALAREGAAVDGTEPVDLESIARDAWANVDSADATLEVAGTTSVDADRDRLQRAFENLFRNAVEHGGASVAVTVGSTDDGFFVADDGPGISPDAVDDVFEYGYSSAADGTGFGLAIVETIVTAHGWTVAIDESHDGAKFVVSGVESAASP